MPMSISEIYAYVFGDKAKMPTLSEETKLTPLQQEKKEARDAAAEATKKADFQFITVNPLLSREFRNLLRDVKNTDLERLLYGNITDVLEKTRQSPRYEMPTVGAINAQFEILNREYGYFTETSLDTFIQLFKASKLIADFVEENNSADNAVAYLHAYKIMVLFKINAGSPFSRINQYIDKHWKGTPKAIHDALVLAIPKNIPPLQHLASWQGLIMQHGNEALSLFQQALAIEARLEEPMTLSTVQKAAVKIQYKQHAINPELALLCGQYHVSEENFDKCLAITPKQTDQLPDVMVDGASLGHPGYCLVKLPIDDPRAYILGDITNCCQNIGGESEQCVIDGITREHNGFYVLLKANPRAHERAVIDGKINYANHAIVGQGYAWLSELDNLTFDSWENLTPSTDDNVIVDLLGAFAQACFKEKPSIGRITIGVGGKTPQAYAVETPYPEKIAEGFDYGDASRQVTIAMNPALLERAVGLNEKLKAVGLVLAFDIFSMKQIKWLESLLTEAVFQHYKDMMGESTYQALLKKASSNPAHLAIITLLHQASLLTKSTSELVLPLHCEHLHDVAEALSVLRKINPALVNDENLKLLAQSEKYANAVLSLHGANLTSDENLKLLAQTAQYTEHMLWVLHLLEEANPALVSDENFKLVAQNAQYAENMFEVLRRLKDGRSLITNENFALLAQNAQYSENIFSALRIINRAGLIMINDKNFKLLARSMPNPQNMAMVLSILYKAHPGFFDDKDSLLNDENMNLLAQNTQYANHIISVLSALYNVNPALVSNKNFKLLAKNVQYAENMVWLLAILADANPALVSDENFALLIQNAQYAAYMAHALVFLYKADPVLVNNENRNLLVQNAQNIEDMAQALFLLYDVNLKLITDENFALLAQNAQYLDHMINGLSTLYKANPALVTDENFKLLIEKVSYPSDIFKKLIIDIVSRAAPAIARQLGQSGLFANCSDGIEQATDKKLEKEAESKESKPGPY